MSNTVITNYTDLNGPSTKADSSVVVIVNKDGSLSVDQKLLGTLMGTDGSQSAGISVVRVGHEGRPDDATDSESEDDKIPHVTLSVDSYYDEPNSIIKYDSGAEMLQSLRIETRENSLLGFQNDHCYTPLKSPTQDTPQQADSFTSYDESVIEIMHAPPPKPVPSSKKITILEQQIIPKGKKLMLKPAESPVIIKGNNVLNKPLPIVTKTKDIKDLASEGQKSDENTESSSISSSGDSIPDRDSDSDYKDTKDRPGALRLKKTKLKPRILKSVQARGTKLEPKVISRLKPGRNIIRKENKEKLYKNVLHEKKDMDVDLESLLPSSKISTTVSPTRDLNKTVLKHTPKLIKKEKKTPAHVHSALLSDMTSLFSTPDVIRRVSTDNKPLTKNEKESAPSDKKLISILKTSESDADTTDKTKNVVVPKIFMKPKEKIVSPTDKNKSYDPMPHIDDASLAQILQDTTGISNPVKSQPTITTGNAMSSPGLTGPLSPTLDLLGGLQPEEEGLTEDFLMSVAQLVATSENLQEVIDKQVLGKVDSTPVKTIQTTPNQMQASNLYMQTISKSAQKTIPVKKDNPIEIVRRDGRVITLPPIEAPATRSSKRKSQIEGTSSSEVIPHIAPPVIPVSTTPEPQLQTVSKQYTNKKINTKKQEQMLQTAAIDKVLAESQESWNSEDDPFRLWCICKQPHNNRFMICCDGCEDWFHGKCVNITKAMGQQMEAQGIEWRCPNCIKRAKVSPRVITKVMSTQSRIETEPVVKEMKSPPLHTTIKDSSKTGCIVCKKPARVSSIYCSNSCIWKHAQDSLGNQSSPTKGDEPGTSSDKPKAESRVIVYERKSGRLLAGPNAPTAENLKSWLQSNPTFEVVRPGTLSTTKPLITKKKHPAEPAKIQTTLNFERIPKKTESLIHRKTENVIAKKPENVINKRPENVIPKKPENVIPKKAENVTPKRTENIAIRKSEHLTPRKSIENLTPVRTPVSQPEVRERTTKLIPLPRDEIKPPPQLKSPVGTRVVQSLITDTPKASTSTARPVTEPRKLIRATSSRSQSLHDKAPPVSPSTSRRKDSVENKNTNKMSNGDYEIRENVRKALQEQISIRMAEPETAGVKFTEDEIEEYANDTENELHELFRDVGMKYKAKYRSLMFNIKDRKNFSLWQKICDRELTPKQLVRLSPEELASQELAQWRDKESKHQLELIKKSELDLLAASKTYVLKTHKGEEVMETKESVLTELDPELVPVKDVVTALNDETIGPEVLKQEDNANKEAEKKKHSGKKRSRDDNSSSHSKRSRRESKRDSDRKSRSSRRRSDLKDKVSREERRRSTRKAEKKSIRTRSSSRDRSKRESKERSEPRDRSRHRSSSREKSRRLSKSREYARSRSQDREEPRRRSQSRDAARRSQRSRSRSRSSRRSSADDKPKLRSRSQDALTNEIIDSTDLDSIERPKSAMLKEVHPEYDPHEPMITSALSEEDLRKSGEDVYEDTYGTDNGTFDAEYVPSKTSVDTSEIVPSPTYSPKQDKTSEAESDQEPTSTVENSAATVWSGCINMVDVARFYVAAYEASGSASDLEEDLSAELDVVGRINPDTVWDYIAKMKKTSNKDIVILRLQTANDEEKMQYIALYSYLSSRNRLGVVKTSHMMTVKDLYIVPLSANAALPAVVRPLDGPGPGPAPGPWPGLGDARTHLLIAIVIRKKRLPLPLHVPIEAVPAKVSRESRKRSFTPPASPRRRAPPTPAYTTPALSTSVKDKIAASLVSADEAEAYSPGAASPSGARADSLRDKMQELNRQIEEQKQQIRKMAQADSSVAEDNEAYSPSRPMTPPEAAPASVAGVAGVASVSSTGGMPLDDIALPSNLQEILATIKQRSETANPSASNERDVDMRTMPLPYE